MSIEAMKQALDKAFQLGQRYWSWAHSEYSSHWKKADAAKAEFEQLVEDTLSTPATDAVYVAGLRASISILSHLVDQQRQLLVEVEDVCGRDGHGGRLEDGESDLIDRVRLQIAAITPPAAQPATVQEPVAWQYRDANDDGTWGAWLGCDKRLTASTWREVRPLYTTPPAAPVPLTDENIDRIAYALTGFDGDGTQAMNIDDIRRIARAAARLTAAQEKGQPC
jgi:hypothetical protein